MATNLSIIIDGDSDAFYFSGSWLTTPIRTMYQQTNRLALGQSSFDFSFEGTSAAFIGVNPVSQATLRVDGGTAISIYDTVTGTYKQWFQTPKLSDGSHTITVNCFEGTEIDFAVVNLPVNTGNQTRLARKDIIVDDDSPSISYSGHWSRNTSQFHSGTFTYPGYPYGNSTHRSSTPGDTFAFQFTGTSVSVYGIYSPLNLGNLTATYTIDGATVPQTYNVTSLGSQNGEVANFVYYSEGNLTAGDHTLTVNITVADNLTFALDYITYSNNTTTPTTTSASIKLSPSSQPSQIQTSGKSQRATIIGGIVAVLALGVFVAILTRFYLRRRKAKQIEHISINNYNNDANNLHITKPNRRQRQQPLLQDHPQPMKHRLLNAVPAEQLEVGGSQLTPCPDPRLEIAADPPPYDTLFSGHPVTQHMPSSHARCLQKGTL